MAVKSSLDLDRDPRVIVGVREFDAPRELVFSVWTDAKHLAQWWGPNGFTTTTSRFEFRPGGVWRFVMHGPDGRDYQNRVVFDEIVPPERIVYRHDGGTRGGVRGTASGAGGRSASAKRSASCTSVSLASSRMNTPP